LVLTAFQGRGIASAATAQAIVQAKADGKHRFLRGSGAGAGRAAAGQGAGAAPLERRHRGAHPAGRPADRGPRAPRRTRHRQASRSGAPAPRVLGRRLSRPPPARRPTAQRHDTPRHSGPAAPPPGRCGVDARSPPQAPPWRRSSTAGPGAAAPTVLSSRGRTVSW
jgi:hypothetical protein